MKNELETAKELGFEDIPTRKDLYEEIERLRARLEKAVELSCKVKCEFGNLIYAIVYDTKVKNYVIVEDIFQLWIFDINKPMCLFRVSREGGGFNLYNLPFDSEWLFSTKAKAEARLAELQSEKALKEKGE